MKIVVQRSLDASVWVSGKCVGKIDSGLMLLVSFTNGDSIREIEYMVDKVINLRIFDDENGVMNKSLIDVRGSILSISQFTLYGDASKGRRPSYINALGGDEALKLYQLFNDKLRESLKSKSDTSRVEEGIFGAEMKVTFTNDGPVTIILEKEGEKNGK